MNISQAFESIKRNLWLREHHPDTKVRRQADKTLRFAERYGHCPSVYEVLTQDFAQQGENTRRTAAQFIILFYELAGVGSQIVTGHDGVSRVRPLSPIPYALLMAAADHIRESHNAP